MIKTDKEIVDSEMVSQKQIEIDNLNRRLEQIRKEKNELNATLPGASNMMSSNVDDVSRMGLDASNKYFSRYGELNKEQMAIEQRISKLNNDINSISGKYEANVSKEAIDEQIRQKKEEAQKARELKKATFKKLKQQYKRAALPTRVWEVVIGRKPNWSKIKNYSQEELDYLLNWSYGKSKTQESRDEKMKEKYQEMGKHIRDINKAKEKRHWNEFANKLQKRPLKDSIEFENKQGRAM